MENNNPAQAGSGQVPAPVAVTPAPQPVQTTPVVPEPVAPVVAQTPAPVVTQPAPVQPTASATPSFELPQGVTDRTTEQFNKLTDSNRKLLEANQILEQELSKRSVSEAQFAPIQQPVVPQQPDVKEFLSVDPLTGEQYIDENKLQASLNNANSRAMQAEQQVKNYIESQQKKEIAKQEEETYSAYPQLNPNDPIKVDRELERLTRAYALDSMMNPRDYKNRSLTFKEAADIAFTKLYGNKPIATPSVEAQQISIQQPTVEPNGNIQPIQGPTASSPTQEQGGMAAEGGAVNVNPSELSTDDLALADRTRRGDMWALAKRLTRTPHTGTPTHGEGD